MILVSSPRRVLLIMFHILPVRNIHALLAPSAMARSRPLIQVRPTSASLIRSYSRTGGRLPRPPLGSLPVVARYAGANLYAKHAGARLTARYISSSDSSISMSTSTLDPMESEQRLAGVRASMHALGLDALIVPSDDPHLSEYVADCYARREYLSGFTGSAGTAVVLADGRALLWTDGRYFLQAAAELGAVWTLMRQGQPGVPEMSDFLSEELGGGATVGVDGSTIAAAPAEGLRTSLEKAGVVLKSMAPNENPVDHVWGSSRPSPPNAPLRMHPAHVCGATIQEKVARMRAAMTEKKADMLLVSALDEVAWLFNLRGGDVDCNPVFTAFAVVPLHDAPVLFLEGYSPTTTNDDASSRFPPEVRAFLQEAGVKVRPYEEAAAVLEAHVNKSNDSKEIEGARVMADPARVNYALWSLVPLESRVAAAPSPLALAKSTKNEAELAGMKKAHVRDGAAVVEFLAWMFEGVSEKRQSISEVEIDLKITSCRKEMTERDGNEQFIGRSFPTIAAEGPNGANPHYFAAPETCRMVGPNSMLLLDSGGQYSDGTTDVTRTLHLGEPSLYQRECFTRVLQGNLNLDSCVFPEGTPGCALDSLARQSLWAAGLDYGHGTGHGVGAALNVHEGPQGIAPSFKNLTPLQAGMVVSNEPGYYLEGHFGIRIENLLVVAPSARSTKAESPSPSAEKGPTKSFLQFERLTQIPIQRNLMDLSLMSASDISWVDNYHAEVRHALTPLLITDRARKWLLHATAPLKGLA